MRESRSANCLDIFSLLVVPDTVLVEIFVVFYSGYFGVVADDCAWQYVSDYLCYRRQPSFSGCRRQDLERIAGQSRLHNSTFVFSTPSENILVPEILLIALQCT